MEVQCLYLDTDSDCNSPVDVRSDDVVNSGATSASSDPASAHSGVEFEESRPTWGSTHQEPVRRAHTTVENSDQERGDANQHQDQPVGRVHTTVENSDQERGDANQHQDQPAVGRAHTTVENSDQERGDANQHQGQPVRQRVVHTTAENSEREAGGAQTTTAEGSDRVGGCIQVNRTHQRGHVGGERSVGTDVAQEPKSTGRESSMHTVATDIQHSPAGRERLVHTSAATIHVSPGSSASTQPVPAACDRGPVTEERSMQPSHGTRTPGERLVQTSPQHRYGPASIGRAARNLATTEGSPSSSERVTHTSADNQPAAGPREGSSLPTSHQREGDSLKMMAQRCRGLRAAFDRITMTAPSRHEAVLGLTSTTHQPGSEALHGHRPTAHPDTPGSVTSSVLPRQGVMSAFEALHREHAVRDNFSASWGQRVPAEPLRTPQSNRDTSGATSGAQVSSSSAAGSAANSTGAMWTVSSSDSYPASARDSPRQGHIAANSVPRNPSPIISIIRRVKRPREGAETGRSVRSRSVAEMENAPASSGERLIDLGDDSPAGSSLPFPTSAFSVAQTPPRRVSLVDLLGSEEHSVRSPPAPASSSSRGRRTLESLDARPRYEALYASSSNEPPRQRRRPRSWRFPWLDAHEGSADHWNILQNRSPRAQINTHRHFRHMIQRYEDFSSEFLFPREDFDPMRHNIGMPSPSTPLTQEQRLQRRARRRLQEQGSAVPEEFRHLQGGTIDVDDVSDDDAGVAVPEREAQIRAKAWERWLCRLRDVEYKEADGDDPLDEEEMKMALPALLNRFTMINMNTVSTTLKETKSYAKAYFALEEMQSREREGRSKRKQRRCDLSGASERLKRQLDAPDFEMKVKEQIDQYVIQRQKAISDGKTAQCGCCFDDEITEAETLSCSQGHAFCFACVRRTAETFFSEGLYASEPGQGNWTMCIVRCMQIGGCGGTFSEAALQDALPTQSYLRYSQRALALSAAVAKVEDLVSCPWCDFVVSMPNQNDSVVVCRNPNCGKQSCRLCKQKSHLPYHCDEIEKDWEVEIRTRIEEAINDEMSRKCPKCRKIFEKTHGCNHMTCVCGTDFCYLCGEIVRKNSLNLDGSAYHYGVPPKCNQFGNLSRAQLRECRRKAELAGIAARDKYLEDHPQHKGKTLTNCPIKSLREKR